MPREDFAPSKLILIINPETYKVTRGPALLISNIPLTRKVCDRQCDITFDGEHYELSRVRKLSSNKIRLTYKIAA